MSRQRKKQAEPSESQTSKGKGTNIQSKEGSKSHIKKPSKKQKKEQDRQ